MKNIIKYAICLFTVLAIRFLPRVPNLEPIMTTMMPIGKKWGVWPAAFFSMLAMVLFDIIAYAGSWSMILVKISVLTAGTYMLLGIAAGKYFASRQGTRGQYIIFAAAGTLVFDLITGLGAGYLFGQTFVQSLVLQIPFTLIHLLGNITFAALISPLLYTWVLDNKELEITPLLTKMSHIFK